MIYQAEIVLPSMKRGIHLITGMIEEKLPAQADSGLLNVFLMHTSAALCINENADFTVRKDMESFLDRNIPDSTTLYTHDTEGSDDMPAHIKTALIGQSVNIPVMNRKLKMGIWQGIYLCEFRNHAGPRRIFLTFIS